MSHHGNHIRLMIMKRQMARLRRLRKICHIMETTFDLGDSQQRIPPKNMA